MQQFLDAGHRRGRSGLFRQARQYDRGRFLRVVVPMAPWVFAAPAVAFALLPSVIGAEHAPDGAAVVAAVTALCALTGVVVQPLARRLDTRARRDWAAPVGLAVLAAGLALGAVTTAADRLDLPPQLANLRVRVVSGFLKSTL